MGSARRDLCESCAVCSCSKLTSCTGLLRVQRVPLSIIARGFLFGHVVPEIARAAAPTDMAVSISSARLQLTDDIFESIDACTGPSEETFTGGGMMPAMQWISSKLGVQGGLTVRARTVRRFQGSRTGWIPPSPWYKSICTRAKSIRLNEVS